MTDSAPEPSALRTASRSAYAFVLLFGVVSLFADMTYEGGRSIAGPFLVHLGATATAVGVFAGLGELLGYGLRFLSGYLSDRTERYWTITIAGYVINLLAVPALALAGRWETAVALMMVERIGKGIRTPARDAMLAHATTGMGRGWGFGLHEAMDQTGALIGPLVVALVLHRTGDNYPAAFGVLLVPTVLSIACVIVARRFFPRPRDLEPATPSIGVAGTPRTFWLYLASAGLVAAAYADYPLVAYHFAKASVIPVDLIPVLYAVGMATAGLAALVAGRLFDRVGLAVVIWATIAAAAFAPLVFLGGAAAAVIGVALWGVGLGVHESVMRAAVAEMVPSDRRAAAYGVFGTGFGVSWFLGSALMGVLYDRSIAALVAFSVVAQLLAVPLLAVVMRQLRRHRPVSALGSPAGAPDDATSRGT